MAEQDCVPINEEEELPAVIALVMKECSREFLCTIGEIDDLLEQLQIAEAEAAPPLWEMEELKLGVAEFAQRMSDPEVSQSGLLKTAETLRQGLIFLQRSGRALTQTEWWLTWDLIGYLEKQEEAIRTGVSPTGRYSSLPNLDEQPDVARVPEIISQIMREVQKLQETTATIEILVKALCQCNGNWLERMSRLLPEVQLMTARQQLLFIGLHLEKNRCLPPEQVKDHEERFRQLRIRITNLRTMMRNRVPTQA